jgi:hypothetical protein
MFSTIGSAEAKSNPIATAISVVENHQSPNPPTPLITPTITPSPSNSPVVTVSEPPFSKTPLGSPYSAGMNEPFTGMSLYRPEAFTQQVTQQVCTGASIQMMLNLIRGEEDHNGQHQIDYVSYEMSHSKYSVRSFGGMPDGWANALVHFVAGDYRAVSYPTFEESIKYAAQQIRLTGRPAGITVYWGTHAWVMVGFNSIGADPALSDDYTVTSVIVMAPDYKISWSDPAPGTTLPMAALARMDTDYSSTSFPTIWTDQFLVIMPWM